MRRWWKSNSRLLAIDTLHVNGKRPGREHADLGGCDCHGASAGHSRKPSRPDRWLDGDQRFFLAWAQIWRAKDRPEYAVCGQRGPHAHRSSEQSDRYQHLGLCSGFGASLAIRGPPESDAPNLVLSAAAALSRRVGAAPPGSGGGRSFNLTWRWRDSGRGARSGSRAGLASRTEALIVTRSSRLSGRSASRRSTGTRCPRGLPAAGGIGVTLAADHSHGHSGLRRPRAIITRRSGSRERRAQLDDAPPGSTIIPAANDYPESPQDG